MATEGVPIEASERIKSLRLQIEDKIKSTRWPVNKRFFTGSKRAGFEANELHPRLAAYLRDGNWCYVHEHFVWQCGWGPRADFLAINKDTGVVAVIEAKTSMKYVFEKSGGRFSSGAIQQVKEYHDVIGILNAKKVIAVFELPKNPTSETYQSERDLLRDGQSLLLQEGVEMMWIPRRFEKVFESNSITEFWLWYDYWHIGSEEYKDWGRRDRR